MSDNCSTGSTNLITRDGFDPDESTIGINSTTGKLGLLSVPGSADVDVGHGLEDSPAGPKVRISSSPDGMHVGLDVDERGLFIEAKANGAGRRYVGTDHTEIASPKPGDIYYEILGA